MVRWHPRALLSEVFRASCVLLVTAGCTQRTTEAAAPQQGPTVLTGSLSYELRDSAGHVMVNLGTTITNHTGSTIHFDTFCNGVLEKRIDESWRPAFSFVCRLGSGTSALVPIASGESYRHEYRVWASRSGSYPRFQVDTIPGVYRLVYRIYSGADGERSQLLPDDERISNQFTLH